MRNQVRFMCAVAALLMTACSNEEDTGISSPVEARFTASIADVAVTRAANTSWDKGDRIGITGKTGDQTYTNKGYYTPDGDGEFEPIDEDATIYYQNTLSVSFTAYYPYKEGAENPTLSANTKDQQNQKDFDFLYGTGHGSVTLSPVKFTFEHKMAKLVLHVVAGNDVTKEDIKKATLSIGNSMYFEGSFNASLIYGSTSTTGTTGKYEFQKSGDYAEGTSAAPYEEEENGRVYTLILFPQEFDNDEPLYFEAVIEQGGETGTQTYGTKIDLRNAEKDGVAQGGEKSELKAGTQYNVTITLNKTGVEFVKCEISDWKTFTYNVSATM